MFIRSFKAPALPHETQLPFQVLLTGHWKTESHSLKDRTLDEWVILFCVKGKGQLQLAGRRHSVHPGQLFVCPPGEPHGYSSGKEGWTIHWVHAHGEGLSSIAQQLGLNLKTPLMKILNPEDLEKRFHQIHRCFSRPVFNLAWEASSRFYDLLLFLLQSYQQPSDQEDLLGCFRPEDTRLEDIVKRSGFSRFHFCRRFKSSHGLTPWEHLTELKVEEAKRRLLQETAPIKVIALELGFPNPDYFSRVFKKSTGRSPSQYRGNLRIF